MSDQKLRKDQMQNAHNKRLSEKDFWEGQTRLDSYDIANQAIEGDKM